MARLDKLRPVVILTREPMGRHLHSVIVAPVTTRERGLSTEVRLGTEDGVLDRSVANLNNLQLLLRSDLVRRLGRARPSRMAAVCDALAIATGCS